MGKAKPKGRQDRFLFLDDGPATPPAPFQPYSAPPSPALPPPPPVVAPSTPEDVQPLRELPPPVVPHHSSEPPPLIESAQPMMHQTALVFLDDPLARRLAVAWVSCGGNDAEWIDAAGLSSLQLRDSAKRLCKALRVNGICRDGGVTDPLALKYIQAIVSEPIKRMRKKE